ncbi:DUF2345 domain-containing protein, partial [Pseudomonas pseudonitroreducens]|uniref:DUF2345 domain-containing protein n=1 Tax=Pseudomonas pseudonitroreducens TaxID=2892326 RepID=UPI001F2214F0
LQAQNDRMEILARQGLDIVSTEDEIHITARKKIVLNAGGTYITMDNCGIESGTQGDYLIKSAHFDHQGPASMPVTHPEYPKLESAQRLRLRVPQAPNAPRLAWAGMPYTLYADGQVLQKGVLDETGYLAFDHQVITRSYRLVMANGVGYQLPIPDEYSKPEQGGMANRGLHRVAFLDDPQINQPSAHNELRTLYASLLDKEKGNEGDTP